MTRTGILMSIILGLLISVTSFAEFNGEPPAWAYDAGPLIHSTDPDTRAMALELVELNANIPYFPGVSYGILGEQKFRPAFGPISWRMLLEPNSVKILFIGQDGTHIAEAAGRPATAGFGGRAHDLANHFGVDYSAAFINTYAFTIRGQYGDRGVPYLKNGRLNFTSQFLDNELWLMSQGQESPITLWRNHLIDWIIRNNKKSLKLIVTFGGSARDSISSYIESKENGEVGTRLSWSELKYVQMPEYRIEYAGGNNTFPVPIDRYGRDLYAELFGKEPNYVPPYEGKGDPDDQQAVQDLLRSNLDQVVDKMVFSRGGVDQSGLLHPAQLGGYDIEEIKVNGRRTISLRGLKLNDGTEVENDVLVVDLPHPTYLSNVQRSQGNKKVSDLVESKTYDLEWWKDRGWEIEPDHGQTSNFFRGGDYYYGRGEIGQEYYDFGTPGNRMVSKSDAKRIDSESILLGTREDQYLSKWGAGMRFIEDMKKDQPAEKLDSSEMFISISRAEEARTDFDPGPGLELAKVMKQSLYGEKLQSKGGTRYENLERIFDSNSTISSEGVGDFGHYRGDPMNAKVVVLADPQGWDSIITARAMTGTRGQYLQGLLTYGITEDDYSEAHFILHTVPFGMDGAPGEPGATDQQWRTLMELTKEYREEVLKFIFDANPSIDLILTDGPFAKGAMEEFMAENPSYKDKAPVIWMSRSGDDGADMFQTRDAIREYAHIKTNDTSYRGERANIPSSHLSYYARVWEGTSKDRVITSKSNPGVAFAEVVPEWVVRQRPKMQKSTQDQVYQLVETLFENCLPKPGEKPDDFLKRKEKGKIPQSCKQ